MNSNASLIAEAKRLDAEATPGGWLASEYLDDGRIGILTDSNGIVVALRSGVATKQDAAFIARTRTLLPQLADAYVALHARFAQLALRHDDKLCDSDLDRGQMCHYCTECRGRWSHWGEADHEADCPARPMEPTDALR